MGYREQDHGREQEHVFVRMEALGDGDRPSMRMTLVDADGQVVVAQVSFAPDERVDVQSFQLPPECNPRDFGGGSEALL